MNNDDDDDDDDNEMYSFNGQVQCVRELLVERCLDTVCSAIPSTLPPGWNRMANVSYTFIHSSSLVNVCQNANAYAISVQRETLTSCIQSTHAIKTNK